MQTCTTCNESLFPPLDLENAYKKLPSVVFLHLLTKFQSDPQRESYDDFPQVTCLECNLGVCKKTNFLRSYLHKYHVKSFGIQTQGSARFFSNGCFLRLLKRHRKKVIAKMPRWPVWSSETLESKALIPNAMKPAQEKVEKIDQRLIIQPLQGGNLLYITKMNNSWMIQMKRPPFYIEESKGS